MNNTNISIFINSEDETITIDRIMGGDFKGQYVLNIIADDLKFMAPHLLDKGTIKWLLKELPKL